MLESSRGGWQSARTGPLQTITPHPGAEGLWKERGPPGHQRPEEPGASGTFQHSLYVLEGPPSSLLRKNLVWVELGSLHSSARG